MIKKIFVYLYFVLLNFSFFILGIMVHKSSHFSDFVFIGVNFIILIYSCFTVLKSLKGEYI